MLHDNSTGVKWLCYKSVLYCFKELDEWWRVINSAFFINVFLTKYFCLSPHCICLQNVLFLLLLTRCGMIWVSDKNLFPFWRAEGSGIQSIHPYPYYVGVFDCLMDERRTFMMQCLPCLKKEICPTYTILYFDIFFIR